MEALQVCLDLRPGDVEQRSSQVAVATPHRGKTARAAAAQQVQEQGLHLVIAGVAKGDGRALGLRGDSAQERVAGGARAVLGPRRRVSGARGPEIEAPAGADL